MTRCTVWLKSIPDSLETGSVRMRRPSGLMRRRLACWMCAANIRPLFGWSTHEPKPAKVRAGYAIGRQRALLTASGLRDAEADDAGSDGVCDEGIHRDRQGLRSPGDEG